jgi:hypothetical protein
MLDQQGFEALKVQTRGQLLDGVGENGLTFRGGAEGIALAAAWNRELRIEQVEDGVYVPPPPRIPISAHRGDVGEIRTALQSGEAVDSRLMGYTGLQLAIGSGQREAALALIDAGADVHVTHPDGDTLLMACATSRAMSDHDGALVAQALIENGADCTCMSDAGETAESYAQVRGKPELLRVLRDEAARRESSP